MEASLSMEASLFYRLMKSGEESMVCALVTHVFNEFVAPDYSDEGAEEFLKYVEPDPLLERYLENHFVLVATLLKEIVGMIEVRDYNHISLLFVDKRFQRIGIGKELLRKSLEICFSHKPGLSHVSVNSSLYAVEVYRKLGFCQQGPRQTVKGICFDPMVLELSGP